MIGFITAHIMVNICGTRKQNEAPDYLVSDIEGAPVRGQYQDNSELIIYQNTPEWRCITSHLAAELEPGNIYYQIIAQRLSLRLVKKKKPLQFGRV